jgi:5-amino-6-(5-phospho-D-ribitylamino)uracil phosphatase
MAKGLIAIDLDGTALDSQQKISDRTKRALREARASGYEVVIATGRPPRSSITYHRELGLLGPIVTFNGAFVHHEDNPDFHFHVPLDRLKTLELLEECRRFKAHNIMMEIKDKFYVWKRDEITDFLSYGGTPAAIGSIEQQLSDHPTVLLVRTPLENVQPFMQEVGQRFGKEVELRYWGDYFQVIEIKRSGISKVTGLSYIARIMGIARERVIAFGDSANDLEMIEWAGLGVAMGNAPDELKKRADDVTESNEQDGIAVFLEKLNL